MTLEDNAATYRRWFDEGWSAGNVDVAPEIFAPGFVLGGERVGPAGPQRSVRYIRAAFHPLTVTIEQQIAEGPWVVTRYRAAGVHAAEYRGLPPSGRQIVARGVQMWRVQDGLAVEDWNTFDEWGLVAQLGRVQPVPFDG